MPIDTRLIIRPAQVADKRILLEMVDAMADYDRKPRLDLTAQQRLIRDAFEKHLFEVVFAEWEGKVVGYAALYQTYSTFEASPGLFIDDLFVRPEYRGRHVGFELFRYCVREAKRRNCGRLEWLVLDWNHPALGFYDHLRAKKLEKWVPFRLNRDDMEYMV